MRTSLALTLVLATSAIARPAQACSCTSLTPEQAASAASAVFEGRVAAIAIDGDSAVVSFDVVQSWRGAEHERVEVRTLASEAMCGMPFEMGRSYLVYAAGEPDELRTGLCARTRRMEEADEDRAFLGSGTIPVDIADEDPTPVRRTGVRPIGGACAGCAASSHEPRWMPGVAVALIACLLGRWRRRA